MPRTRPLLALAAAATLCLAPPPAAAETTEIVIGTGSTTGVYYQVGRALCRLLTRTAPVEGLTCRVEDTAGSISNLRALREGTLHLGVVQSDWQYHAVAGSGPFAAEGADGELRALFSVHGEPFTVVARADSGIERFSELAGRKVNIGNPGSGQRGTMERVMQAMGWTRDSFALAEELTAAEHSLALCHARVEAIVYTVGHPNASIAQATGLCDARLVEVAGPEIEAMVAELPYYGITEIPGGIYAANPEPVTTFGVLATVVATTALADDTAHAIVATLFDNLDTFRRAHPAFGALQPAAMARDGLSAPLHAGALRYFRETGIETAEPAGQTPG
ncbi:TAXI family TRAP transporter solute-binding subunit [Paralimibaculum aggregatum]|uniref:TAXI family TRAP transporter solute-binding subunit n=1 Tax=Paralimibaculum aggregatum TaxID=3036245 RepID=A0ABQ6LST1_9RHOB|nr:TAXI family TRAP transporter solute-binding subunit [Limibaculum sp. NKW23]GMG85140.1 TAXI family TRAP transporter solute-binding subunit [Limibaculum sp. NKW23]